MTKQPSHFRRSFIGTLLVLGLLLFYYPKFLNGIEERPGQVLNDPLLARLPIVDATWYIFTLVYFSLALGLSQLVSRPKKLLVALQGYGIMLFFRMIAMSLVPLDPPAGMIALNDPFVQAFGSSGRVLTRDLFFSGHTATCFLIFLNAVSRRQAVLLLTTTVAVMVCVLLQHVHYSIDVFVAPFFTYAAHRIAIRLTSIDSSH